MLKRVLHTANQVVTHEETHTGTRELTIENTVNDNVDMLTVTGDSWQLAQEEIKDEEGNVTQPAIPSIEHPSDIISVDGEMVSCGWNLWNAEKAKDVTNWVSSSAIPVYPYFPIYVGKGNKVIITNDTLPIGLGFYCAITLKEDGVIYKWIYHSKSETSNNNYIGVTAIEDYIYIRCLNGTVDAFIENSPNFQITVTDERKPDRYRGNSITLPTLRSLPDGTKDVLYVDRKNQRAWVERKIGETVLDGSETWSVYADIKGVIEYMTIKMGVNDSWSFPLRCSHCKSTTGYNIYVQDIVDDMVFGIPVFKQLVFGSKSKTGIFESIDTFKAFLSEHPVTVQYGLIDPIIEELPYADYLLETAQYQTNIRMTGLNENLQPEITAQCKILGR